MISDELTEAILQDEDNTAPEPSTIPDDENGTAAEAAEAEEAAELEEPEVLEEAAEETEETEETDLPPSILDDIKKDHALSQPVVALTFDDGPSEYTSRILDTLQQHGGNVTFFVQGSLVEQNKTKVTRAMYMDCEIICHAWDHPDLTTLPKRAIKKQLVRTLNAIREITGKTLPMFRPPYGYVNEKVIQVARKLGLAIIIWSLDPKDWDVKDADLVYSSIMDNVKDGDMILCHDVYKSTADAMSRVIPELIRQGYRLVTVSELLRMKYGSLIPGDLYY